VRPAISMPANSAAEETPIRTLCTICFGSPALSNSARKDVRALEISASSKLCLNSDCASPECDLRPDRSFRSCPAKRSVRRPFEQMQIGVANGAEHRSGVD